jgi:DNA polymerase-3 subunit epsilon
VRAPWRRRRSEAAEAYARAKLPPGATPWREAPFAVVDLEMTGLDPGVNEIISFASVPVEEGRVVAAAVRTTLVRPERMPTENTIRIHGLRPEDLTSAPPLEDAIELILEALTGRILVAHPAWVERAFLGPALQRSGVKLAEPVLCTAHLASHALGGEDAARPGRIPLAEAAGRLGLPVHSPHEAVGDALTAAQILLACATRLERREPQTVGSLARYSDAPGAPWASSLRIRPRNSAKRTTS